MLDAPPLSSAAMRVLHTGNSLANTLSARVADMLRISSPTASTALERVVLMA